MSYGLIHTLIKDLVTMISKRKAAKNALKFYVNGCPNHKALRIDSNLEIMKTARIFCYSKDNKEKPCYKKKIEIKPQDRTSILNLPPETVEIRIKDTRSGYPDLGFVNC